MPIAPSSYPSPHDFGVVVRWHKTCGQSTSNIYIFYQVGSSSSIISSAANLPADCINLGQGYMNFPPPKWVTDAADDALRSLLPNHYSHPKGRIRLRNAIKNFYEKSFNRDLDVETEILVTSGANQGSSSLVLQINQLFRPFIGQYSVFTAFLEHGDEVIMFEPFFDQYLPSVTFNGGTPVYVPLHPQTDAVTPNHSNWKIDFDELRYVV